ncbi:hypothetical protein K1719_030570 [Acacia pycnantha]|nr:hypothetical protein K1719_030570 [Acacia pycnantha]
MIQTVMDFFQRTHALHKMLEMKVKMKILLRANCTGRSALSIQNSDINAELLKKTKILNKVKEKDVRFSKFIESYFEKMEQSKEQTIAVHLWATGRG